MSELENLCHALEDSVRPLPALAVNLQQRAARLRAVAAQVEQAARQVENGSDVSHVVRGLHEAAGAMGACSHSLDGAVQQSRNFIARTIGGGGGAGAPGGRSLTEATPAGWPGSDFGLSKACTDNGGINLLPPGDRAGQMASEVDGVSGFTDVVIHGNEHEFGTHDGPGLTANDLGSVVESTPELVGRPLRLLSCSTGRLDEGPAQQLADRIGQPVMAPSDVVHLVGRPGKVRMVVGPNPFTGSGSWHVYWPTKSMET